MRGFGCGSFFGRRGGWVGVSVIIFDFSSLLFSFSGFFFFF